MKHALTCCTPVNNLNAAIPCNWYSGNPQGIQVTKLPAAVILLFSLCLSAQPAKRLYTGVLGNKVDKKVSSSWNYKQIRLGKMWFFKQEEFTVRCSCKRYYRMLNKQMVRTSVLRLVQQLAPEEAEHSFTPRAGHQFTPQSEGKVPFAESPTPEQRARQTWL